MRASHFISLAVVAAMLSACQQPYGGAFGNNATGQSGISKQNVGTLAGAAGGALLGAQVGKGKGKLVGVALGTLLGAGLGSELGASLDRADQAYYGNSAQTAFESARTGQTQSWTNPDSGNHGSITPTRTYQNSYGDYCREFSHTIYVGGKSQKGYGTACRQPDGTWQIVSQ